MMGGAEIFMRGSGFSSRSPLENRVSVGLDLACPVIEYYTTTTQVACTTPPSPHEQTLRVDIFVDSKRIAPCSNVRYDHSYTPNIEYLDMAANPGDDIRFTGQQRVATVMDIDYFKINDMSCTFKEKYEFSDPAISSYWPRSIPCTVPEITAGYYKVSQRTSPFGYAQVYDTANIYKDVNTTYNFALIPEIISVSSNTGSVKGQILTINGKGFSANNNNKVMLGDVACSIISQSSVQIVCELQSRANTNIPTQSYHAGLKAEIFSGEALISKVYDGTTTITPTVIQRL
jgi:hypothetical protein